MKTIEVEIEGITPLLMHSPENMEEQKPKKNPGKNYDPKVDAENVAYRNKDKELCVPSRCLKAAILNAASWYKIGKLSLKPLIAGCSRIEPYDITLTDEKGKALKDYEIDRRPVVVQRNRIIRSRPRLDSWRLKFDWIYNEEIIGDTEVLKNVITEAGIRIGLLDNRPQKYGENGTFQLVGWKENGK